MVSFAKEIAHPLKAVNSRDSNAALELVFSVLAPVALAK
jgi:hypothetical protein